MKFILLLGLISVSSALIVNPVVDTDKSVNTYSVQTMAADLVNDAMTADQKIDALFHFHRRMMHHFRLNQNTEDNTTTFDLVKLYTVYGSSWCTQQATVFRTLCSEVFGWGNTQGTAGNGALASTGASGGHSSFHLRFDSTDAWHWVDPIIGAYARKSAGGPIASLDEIAATPSILINAEAEGRASAPYFMCNRGTNPIPAALAAAYSYFDYDTAFMIDFASAWSVNQWTDQEAYFTTKKSLKKGETYLWHWDFLEGDYFNLQDRQIDTVGGLRSRAWEWYPPRHLCGWKDSLDTVNWPYFKPYKKVIKGDTCYRYYANGVHAYEPSLRSGDPKDSPYINRNIAFYTDDRVLPALRPAATDSLCEIAWRIKLPYPLMSMRISCDVVKKNAADSLSLSIGRLYFHGRSSFDSITRIPIPEYQDTLTLDSFQTIKTFGVGAAGTLDTLVRERVDPLTAGKTFQGYIIRFRMKAASAATDVGINALKVECIFQHNMFALPQLEPGVNNVTLAVDPGSDLSGENLLMELSWMDNGAERTDTRLIAAAPASYAVTVNQPTMPRMTRMRLANLCADSIAIERALRPRVRAPLALICSPNPFRSRVAFRVQSPDPGYRLSIFNAQGELMRRSNSGESWDASGFPAGLYVVRLSAAGKSVSKKIVLMK